MARVWDLLSIILVTIVMIPAGNLRDVISSVLFTHYSSQEGNVWSQSAGSLNSPWKFSFFLRWPTAVWGLIQITSFVHRNSLCCSYNSCRNVPLCFIKTVGLLQKHTLIWVAEKKKKMHDSQLFHWRHTVYTHWQQREQSCTKRVTLHLFQRHLAQAASFSSAATSALRTAAVQMLSQTTQTDTLHLKTLRIAVQKTLGTVQNIW